MKVRAKRNIGSPHCDAEPIRGTFVPAIVIVCVEHDKGLMRARALHLWVLSIFDGALRECNLIECVSHINWGVMRCFHCLMLLLEHSPRLDTIWLTVRINEYN